MRRIAFQNRSGFTLIEVMLALVIALLVFFALMQTALVGIDSNMKNILRDEAVSIADMRMKEMRNKPFASVVSDAYSLTGDCPASLGSTGLLVEKNVKNITGFDFCTNMAVTTLGSDNKRVDITVGWKWKGQDYLHRITTILRS